MKWCRDQGRTSSAVLLPQGQTNLLSMVMHNTQLRSKYMKNIYCSFLFVYCHNVHALYYIHYMLVFLHLRFPEIISDDKSNIVVP
jgi:hypothetical protein